MSYACGYCGGHALVGAGIHCPECDGSGMESHQSYLERTNQQSVSADCTNCDRSEEVTVPTTAYNKWLLRENSVQSLFPDLTDSQREVLMGERGGYFICSVCWPEVMGSDDE